ncbi:MAG: [acyl-carrier-protein] S-malonyltransferase [Solibacterales bacterium]|nr:[acyl-carrier-protein] S-malonyltransferase [Bryobacterales bacterium]|tara:strand:+ start:13845 stop:14768 length:924 start_codon:yes stop_codon:yes gene_type:complete
MQMNAFLFPGQGSQYAGMGRELVAEFPVARSIFEQADDALGFSLSELCFEGPEEQLKLTENTQPAILTCSVAFDAVLKQEGIRPHYVAGHSLGEYSALTVAGSLSFTDAVRIVRKRGQYMQSAVPQSVGAMAALIGLPPGERDQVCETAMEGEVVSPANLNSPSQIVIAGHVAAVERAIDVAKKLGAKKAILLPVSAPFHCALMNPAKQQLVPDLDSVEFLAPNIPLVNNFGAEVVETGVAVREGLKQQVCNPVRWEESIRRLTSLGVGHFIEVGPGRVLTGLMRSIDRSLNASNMEDLSSLEKLTS